MTHTVLLVDDDSDVLHSLARMLQKQPYQLYTARSAEEAIVAMKTRRVDVIVADDKMPGMSGTDLLAWVASHYPDITRIMLTGFATLEMAVQAINEGSVYHFFTKPCNEAHLAVAICRALEHKDIVAEHEGLLEKVQQQAHERAHCATKLEILSRVVSRDLSGPLGSVARSCQAILQDHEDSVDPKARTLLEEALDAVSDIQAILNDQLLPSHPSPSALLQTSAETAETAGPRSSQSRE